MQRGFHPDDAGKAVVTAEGDVVGHVTRVREGVAYVRPRPVLVRGLGSWLESPWDEDGAYPLDERSVGRVTDTEIRLREGGGPDRQPPRTPQSGRAGGPD